jgi:uncharacterized OsmC-like protein
MAPYATFPETAAQPPRETLRERYARAPEEARITEHGRTAGNDPADPYHGTVRAGEDRHDTSWWFGIHGAVGGQHDAPNPGDILCAALAACLDSTLRIIARRLGVTLERLEVGVLGEVDVRGALALDRDVPVGFQSMECRVLLQTAPGTDPSLRQRLLEGAERSCIVMQTLRAGVPVLTRLSTATSPA